jgi:hypothetical protein
MATPVTGITTAYDLTTGVKVNMDDVIYTVDPIDSPLLGGVGSDGLSVLSTFPVDQISFSWMEESLLTPRCYAGGTSTTGDAFLTFSAGDRERFSTNDVIRIVTTAAGAQNELVRVTGYATTANTLDVTRGFNSTTAATITTGTALFIGVGTAIAEGSNPMSSRQKDRDSFSNVTQIFGPTQVSMSGTEQVVSKYGVPNEFSRQVYNRTVEQVISREQAYLYGRKFNSTTLKVRTTGGLHEFITTNVEATSTQLTVANVQGMQQSCYIQGGLPDRLIANPRTLADLNDVANTSVVRQVIVDTMRGRVPVDVVWTEFGPISVIRDRWVARVHAFLIKRDGVVRRVLRPYQMERLAKTGDADNVQLLIEEGLEVKGQAHMGMFTLLTATAYTGGL